MPTKPGSAGYQPRTTPAERRAFFDLKRQISELIASGGGGGGSTILTGPGAPNAGTGSTGDFYIDTTDDVMYGPKTAGGSWPVAMDPESGGGGTSVNEVVISTTEPSDPAVELWYDSDAVVADPSIVAFEFVQGVPAAMWTINHPLAFQPNVTVIDSGGSQVEGDVSYVDADTLTVTFSGAFSGKAYLS